jgi:hypothetical protein
VTIGIALHHGEELTVRPNVLTATVDIGEERGTIDLNPGVGGDHQALSESDVRPRRVTHGHTECHAVIYGNLS